MKKEQSIKTEIELGILPPLLKEGKVFGILAMVQQNEHQQYVKRYKSRVYQKMNEILGDERPKSVVSYRQWFTNPEKHVNEAFLERERKDAKKWMLIVYAMYFALSDALLFAAKETKQFLALYKERDEKLCEALNIYENHLNEK
jgi:hypothetical protein